MKQTQYNIKYLYDVHPSSRNVIVSQLKALLNNSYPKIIIKSDIKSFYENISTQSLLSTLNSNSLLSLTSKKIIKQILKKFQDESGVTKGIPRGIGLSAYLSEIYLKGFDEKIKSHPEIIYYERYVDDIIAVFTPNSINQVINYKEIYKKFIIEELGEINLPVNTEKTIPYDLINESNKSISYLGYEFRISNAPVQLSPTGNRITKYKYRIEKTFDSYLKDMKRNEKKARRKLIMRLKFLTGNTKLKKNKKNALIGVYFSNCFSTDLSKIYSLDYFLNHQKTKITNPLVLEKISKFTFKAGFDEKTFYNFTQTDFNEIVAAWKQ